MKKLFYIFLVKITLFSSITHAGVDNLIGEYGSNIIKVISENGLYSFEFCKEQKKQMICTPISKQKFSQQDLKEIISKEKTEFILKTAGVVVGSIGVAILAVYAGLFATNLFFLDSLAAIVGVTSGTSLIAGWTKAIVDVDKINPKRQYKQYQALKAQDFINNDVVVDEEEVKRVAELLEEILPQ